MTEAFIVQPGAGRLLDLRNFEAVVLATAVQTGDQFTLLQTQREPPDFGPPLHIHHDAAEAFYVLSGEYLMFVAQRQERCPPGTFVYIPKGVPHTFRGHLARARHEAQPIRASGDGRVLRGAGPGRESGHADAGAAGRDRQPQRHGSRRASTGYIPLSAGRRIPESSRRRVPGRRESGRGTIGESRLVVVEMILVVGGTGELGGRVVRLLRKEGADVRCLVRADSDSPALRDLGVDVVRGDLTEPASLPAACEGVATVVATATVIARRLAGARKPTLSDVDHHGMLALIDAAEAAGVERFVYMSYPGVDADATPLARAKRANEQRLGTSAMRTVIVRSDAFQEIHLGPLARFDIAAGKVAIIGRGDSPQRWVGTDDVAALVAAVAVEADPPALITVGGPEAMSKNEAVALVESQTGHQLKVQRMPRGLARVAVRLLQRPNDAMASVIGLGLMQDTRPADWDDQAFRDRGINARPASDFLREQAELLA